MPPRYPSNVRFTDIRWPGSEEVELGPLPGYEVQPGGVQLLQLGQRLQGGQRVRLSELNPGEYVVAEVNGRPGRIYADRVVVGGVETKLPSDADISITPGARSPLAIGSEVVVVNRLVEAHVPGRRSSSMLRRVLEAEGKSLAALDKLHILDNNAGQRRVGAFTRTPGQTVPVELSSESVLWLRGHGKVTVDAHGYLTGIDKPYWPGRSPRLATANITVGQPAAIVFERGYQPSETPVVEGVAVNVSRVSTQTANQLTDGAVVPPAFAPSDLGMGRS